MRVETKTTWIADNGAEFDSEMACLIYEAGDGLPIDEATAIAERLKAAGYTLTKAGAQAEVTPEPGPDGWIEWTPGPLSRAMPPALKHDTIVECRMRNSTRWPDQIMKASAFVWRHDNTGDDIVAYRVVKEA